MQLEQARVRKRPFSVSGLLSKHGALERGGERHAVL